jgi:NADH-quinone oxidoreductase subunit A
MAAAYLPILIAFAVGGVVCFVMVFGGWLLGPKNPTVYKEAPYECGVEPVGDARGRFPIKFFLVAILFIIFDIESIFLYPWYTVFRHGSPEFQRFTLIEVGTFFFMLFVGYVYLIKRNAIGFEESTLVEPAPTSADEEEAA